MSGPVDPTRLSEWAYRRRARRAARRMTPAQRGAFDLLFWERLTLAAAAGRLSLDEQEVLRQFVAAFRIHVAEIERPRSRWWWRWRWWRN